MQNKDKGSLDGISMQSELKKVIWPTGKQTIKSTAITIAFVLLISVILVIFNFFFDFISGTYYKAILGIDGNSGHNHSQTVVSGDVSGDISGDVSGELLVEVSGETLSNE